MVMVLDTSNKLKTDANARGMHGEKGGKYMVMPFTFPSDLFTAGPKKYANAWMMININVMGNSRISEVAGATVKIDDNEKRRFTNIDTRASSPAGTAATLATVGGIVGLASAVNLGQAIEDVTTMGPKAALIKQGVGIAVGAAKGAALGAFSALPVLVSGTAKRETKRLLAAIQFPMPNALQTSYSMEWGETETAILDLVLRSPQLAAGAITGLMTGGNGVYGEGQEAAASVALKTQSFVGSGGISVASGLAANPKKEQLFSGVGFREFTLEYKFYPKDEQEASYLLYWIIPLLKYHMHPEYKSKGRFTFIYPSEFDITFYIKGEENTWINKIATCVLKSMNVNYTPDGNWVSHESGAPNVISLSLVFKELSVLTKESIGEGY